MSKVRIAITVSILVVGAAVIVVFFVKQDLAGQAARVSVETDGMGFQEITHGESRFEDINFDGELSEALPVHSSDLQAVNEVVVTPESAALIMESTVDLNDVNLTSSRELGQNPNVFGGQTRDSVPESNDVLADFAPAIVEWLDHRPADGRNMIRFAEEMEDVGQFGEAESILSSVQSIYPSAGGTYEALGRMYYQRGEYDKAIGQYHVLSTLLPDDLMPVLQLIDVQIEAGYIEEALVEICTAIKDHPLQPDLQQKSIRALDHLDDNQALDFVRDWVLREPENTDARQILAAQYASGEDYQGALNELDAIIEDTPDLPNNYVYRAVVLEELGLMSEALESRQKAVEMVPHNPDYQLDLAQMLFDDCQYERSMDYIQKTIDLMPENSEREPAMEQLELACQFIAAGQMEQAMASIQAALELTPKNASAARPEEQTGLTQAFIEENQPVEQIQEIQAPNQVSISDEITKL